MNNTFIMMYLKYSLFIEIIFTLCPQNILGAQRQVLLSNSYGKHYCIEQCKNYGCIIQMKYEWNEGDFSNNNQIVGMFDVFVKAFCD